MVYICIIAVLNNVAVYMEFLPLEAAQSQWGLVIQELEKLFDQIFLIMNKYTDYTCLFLIMATLLKVSYTTNCKPVLEPFSRLMCFILQNCSFRLDHLVDICSLSNRAFGKDRGKQYLGKKYYIILFYSPIRLKRRNIFHSIQVNLK